MIYWAAVGVPFSSFIENVSQLMKFLLIYKQAIIDFDQLTFKHVFTLYQIKIIEIFIHRPFHANKY